MTIRQRVTVLPGGTIEIHDPQLPDGAEAEVLVTVESQEEKLSLGEFEPDLSVPPFWERIQQLGASIPDEEWEKVPRDLAKNLNPVLSVGTKAEVIVLVEQPADENQPLVSFLGRGKGCFADAAEVDSFLRAEREISRPERAEFE